MVTLDEPVLVGSDCKTAVTFTVDCGVGTELGAVYKPETLMLPTVVMSPLVIPFTCQLTAKLPAFCTVAVNCMVVPAKGCAEAGDTLTITGVVVASGSEDTGPPQEIKNIFSSGKRRKIDEAPRCKARGSMASCGWRVKPTSSREESMRICRSNGGDIGSAKLSKIQRTARKLPQH